MMMTMVMSFATLRALLVSKPSAAAPGFVVRPQKNPKHSRANLML